MGFSNTPLGLIPHLSEGLHKDEYQGMELNGIRDIDSGSRAKKIFL